MAFSPHHAKSEFSSREWSTNVISYNKFVKFWFYAAIYFDSIYVHVAVTLLGGITVLMYCMFVEMDIPNLENWHKFIILCSHLAIPFYGGINSLSCLRRSHVLRNFELQARLIQDSLPGDISFGAVQKLLLIAGLYQSFCFFVTILFFSYNARVIINVNFIFFVDHMAFMVFHLYLHISVAHYCISISIIGQCMLRMRHAICSFRNMSILSNISIRKFISHYDCLIEFNERISKYFGPIHLFIVAHFMLALVFEAYFIIWSIDNKPFVMYAKYNSYIVGLGQLAYLGLVVGAGSLLIVSCAINEREAEKFNEALASLCIRDKTGTLVKNPYVTAHFAIGKKLKFSACGCFNIDYRLGYSMLAACITYLVILVEFDNKKDISEAPVISTTPFPT